MSNLISGRHINLHCTKFHSAFISFIYYESNGGVVRFVIINGTGDIGYIHFIKSFYIIVFLTFSFVSNRYDDSKKSLKDI